MLIKLKFAQSLVNPCLLTKNDRNGPVFIVIHVDDCYVAGRQDRIMALKEGLEKTFKVKQEDTIDDYLSCNIKVN